MHKIFITALNVIVVDRGGEGICTAVQHVSTVSVIVICYFSITMYVTVIKNANILHMGHDTLEIQY